MPTNDENLVPPPPYNEPVLTPDGRPSKMWARWFRQVWIRIGKEIALNNVQLENVQQEDYTEVIADIATLESQMTAVQNTNTTQTTNINALSARIEALELEPAS